MATKIIHKKSSTASSIPAANTLEPGEIAVNLADKKLYSKQTDGTVVELAPRGDASLLSNVEFTATANQTTFSTTYDVGGIQVFLNGVRLQDSDFTATNGSTIILASGAAANDVLSVQKFEVAGINVTAAVLTDAEFTATANQTTFTTNYTVGTIQVFLNGIKLQDADYTATNGTTVVLAVGADAGDLLEVQKFTYAGVYTVNLVDDSTPQLGGDLASNGNDILFADNDKAIFGAGPDLAIYHDGTNSLIDDTDSGFIAIRSDTMVKLLKRTGDENMVVAVPDGAVTLYHNNAAKLATTIQGVDVTDKINIEAASGFAALEMGGPSGAFLDMKAPFSEDYDGRIQYDVGGDGALIINTNSGNSSPVIIRQQNSEKLRTTATGVTVTGTVAATAFTGDGSGLTGLGGGVPAGSVIYHAANTAPTGFLKANGAAVSRSTYSDLFTAIGTTFGAGDGSSTFLVPDLRGEFLRGWDDSRGIDSGRSFGSAQADAFKSHQHQSPWNFNTGYNPPYGYTSHSGFTEEIPPNTDENNELGMLVSSTGGSETRPRNIALLACIKY